MQLNDLNGSYRTREINRTITTKEYPSTFWPFLQESWVGKNESHFWSPPSDSTLLERVHVLPPPQTPDRRNVPGWVTTRSLRLAGPSNSLPLGYPELRGYTVFGKSHRSMSTNNNKATWQISRIFISITRLHIWASGKKSSPSEEESILTSRK